MRLRDLLLGTPTPALVSRLSVDVERPLRVTTDWSPPQSDDELRPFRDALNRLDHLLELRWNAQAVRTSPGSYDAQGRSIPADYEGRWEIIRRQTPGVDPARRSNEPYTLICTVTEYTRVGGVLAFVSNGTYAPVDERLLEVLRAADAANVQAFTEMRRRLWASHDALEEREGTINEAEAREGLDHEHFRANYAGGSGNWIGRGANFTPTT